MIEIALKIALDAHKGQVDKAGQPYILHPLRVMARAKTGEEQIASLLHDVIEDSNHDYNSLVEAGISTYIAGTVHHLSRTKEESYNSYIKRILPYELACRVKMLDIEDNLNILRLSSIGKEDLNRFKKYHATWNKLNDNLKDKNV